MTGNCPADIKKGLFVFGTPTVTASYWDTNLTGINDSDGMSKGQGLSTSEMRTPTSAVGVYAGWDNLDVDADGASGEAPWDFGKSNDHPILRYDGLAAAPQLDAQPDTAPTFATSTPLTAMTLPGNVAVEFQLPVVIGGNGALTYARNGLPAGLSFGLPDCATERTVCGTPTAATTTTVTVTVRDSDSNTDMTDEDTLTFAITVPAASARMPGTTPATLMESNLHGASVVVELSGSVFDASVSPSGFQATTTPPIAGLSIASATRTGATSTTLRLRFTGDFTAQSTLAVRVLEATHRFGGDQDTGTVAVAPTIDVALSETDLALNEAPGAANANVGTYTVVLTGQPPGAATVTPTSGNPDVTTSGALTFAATTWNTAQTVTVTAGRDDDAADDVAHVTHAVQGVPVS